MKNNNNNDNNKTESCGAPDRTPHMKTVYNWWDAPFDTFTEIKGTIETDLAICKFERQTEEPLNTVFKITHFPHVMQVMYMCFSHWSKHPDKLPVLYLHQSNETYTNPLRGAFSKNAFLKGFLAMLESGMNLEVWSEKQIRWWLSENHHGTDDGTDDGDVDFEFLEATQPRGYAFSHPEILSKISVDYFAHRQRRRKIEGEENRDDDNGDNDNDNDNDNALHRQRRKIEGEENRDDNDNDDAGGGGAWTCPAPRIGILNRKGTRSFENLDDLERHLETSRQLYDPDDDDGRGLLPLVPPEVSSIYFENATFSEQVGFFHSVDFLLTPHGAQSTGLPFLANTACPHFIEIFPESYVMPGFFGTLSTYSEIRYSYFHVSSSSSLSGADDDDVELPPTTDYNDDDSFNLDNDHSIHDTDLKKEKLPVIILETTRERIRSRSTNFCVDRYAVAYSLRNALLDWCVCQKDLLL